MLPYEAENDQPLFSIICSLRKNYQCFLNDLLLHIVNQSFERFECIFITDEKEIDWIRIPDGRFKLIHLEKEEPLAKKRNIGIEKSKGEYIIFCDADDYLDDNLLHLLAQIVHSYHPDYILPKITRNPEEIEQQGKHILDESNLFEDRNKIIDIFFSRYLSAFTDRTFRFDGSWGRAFKRSIIKDKNIRFFEEPCRAEDALFVNDFVLNINSVYLIPDYFGYFWRINNKSEMFNANSFFYNIAPFAERLYLQLKKVPSKYSTDFEFYISRRVVSEAGAFCKARFYKQIDKKDYILLLDKCAPKKSVCSMCLKRVGWKYGVRNKILSMFYFCRFYGILYFVFFVAEKMKKAK